LAERQFIYGRYETQQRVAVYIFGAMNPILFPLSDNARSREASPPDRAIRSPKAFGRSPESWLQLLPQYDLWQDEQRSDTIKVKHFATPAPC